MLLLLAAWSAAPAQQNPAEDDEAMPEGVEVLARGPVHEAYAEPAQFKPSAAAIIAREPPEAIEEEPPDQKPDGDNVQWLPGYWAWDEERDNFLWVSGFWRLPPPNRNWLPGHWNRVETGWQWVPGFWMAAQAPGQPAPQERQITYLPPPPAPMEVGPSVPAPDADHYYVSGYWVHRDSRYVWRPGFWARCRPNWVWVPARYVWSPCGYVFVDGYWDYTLRERGLLFAPVAVNLTVVRRPGWRYCPRYVIHDDCLTAALFVRPGCSSYYFGDYFETAHRRAGYIAWHEVRVGHCHADPLFSYYRASHRATPAWEISLRASYVGRYNGEIARPPRTLVQQKTVINNITVNNVTNKTTIVNNVGGKTVNNISNGTMLTSLKQVEKKGVVLKPVAPAARQAEAVAAKQVVKAAAERGRLEREVQARGPLKATDAPRTVKVDLPRPVPAARTETAMPAQTPATFPRGGVRNPVSTPTVERKDPAAPPRIEGKGPAPRVESKNPVVAPKPGIVPKVEAKAPAIAPKAEGKNPVSLPTAVTRPAPLPARVEPKAVAPPPAVRTAPPPAARPAPVPPPPPPVTRPGPQTAPKLEVKPPPRASTPPPTRPAPNAKKVKDKDNEKEKANGRR